jgi:hypothetical protein
MPKEEQEPDAKPEKGDITLCLNCGAFLTLADPETGQMILATPADIKYLSSAAFAHAMRTKAKIIRRGPFWSKETGYLKS